MALPTSGALSLEMIRAEFGGGHPIYLSDYYRGGPRVPNTPANAGIPTSGTIYLSQFYGASASTTSPLSISAPDAYRQVNSGTATATSIATGSGGTGGYTYTWTSAVSGATFSSNGATAQWSATRSISGQATVTVRDSSGATASVTIVVTLEVGRPV